MFWCCFQFQPPQHTQIQTQTPSLTQTLTSGILSVETWILIFSLQTGLEYIQHYQGEPREPDPKAGAMEGHVSIWDAHMGLFIAVIVLLIICLIVIIIGILCIKCKGEKSKPEKVIH